MGREADGQAVFIVGNARRIGQGWNNHHGRFWYRRGMYEEGQPSLKRDGQDRGHRRGCDAAIRFFSFLLKRIDKTNGEEDFSTDYAAAATGKAGCLIDGSRDYAEVIETDH